MNSEFLKAFEATNKRIPVWFMRQAGRYLSSYQQIRKKKSLEEMFKTPEIASEITCQPVEQLEVDAAILFADILTLPAAMGMDITFDNKQGPVIENLISSEKDLKTLRDFKNLDYVAKTIDLVNQRLPQDIPLIGFAGSPFSVLTYMIEGGSSLNYTKTFKLMYENLKVFESLMKILTKNTIDYLELQKEAGIKAFQIFDTWAGILRPADFAKFVLPYVSEIFVKVNLPSIYYVKNTNHLLSLMDKTRADVLSVDQTVVLGHHGTIERTKKGIQGNLFNGLLFADDKTLVKEVKDVLEGGKKHKRYIFNLSHGVFPDTNPEKLKLIIKTVKEFPLS